MDSGGDTKETDIPKNNFGQSNDNSCLWGQMEDDDALLLVDDKIDLNTSFLRSDEKYIGFDNNVGDTWIYPTNLPERAYQYNIVQKALFHNTLVVLPTGLGKTLIAAVVMYNMYRWYPLGKVIFMAPTRPLVAQQIEACCNIMGIPKEDSVEITGKLNKTTRTQLWQSKRVFFATPQTLRSDIFNNDINFPFQSVKLIVVDEAHKAKGRYAYTEVIRYIWSKSKHFRILALSATPGRRKEDVAEIIRNLFISNLEVRSEESVDVVSYVHKRKMKTVVVNLGRRLTEIRDELLAIADPHLRNLIESNLIIGRPGNVSRNWLVMEHKKFRENLNNRTPQQKQISADFTICISVYHAIELLERHGLRVFLNNFDETQDGGPKFVIFLKPDLRRLIESVRQEVGPNPFAFSDQNMVNGEIAPVPRNLDFGHPKFEIARDHVLAHFEKNKDSRVIIFCEYRESVMLMHRLLLQHRPMIRPRLFVGQGGTGSIRAITQQQQAKVMNDFRSGESNTLIATSVAEEGIDVGEVDLIVCFDINTTNPTRFIQRIGRTGRKKEGNVLLLATEGKEHMVLKEVLSERNKLNKSISRGGEFASVFYKYSPRMVPTEFNPKCRKVCIQPPVREEPKSKEKPKMSKNKNQRFIKKLPQRDLRHFFKQNVVLDEEEQAIFENVDALNSTANKSTSRRNLTADQDEVLADMDFSASKSPNISNKLAKKIAKYIRSSKSETVTAKTLSVNRLSSESYRFMLDFSPDHLKSVWNRMQGLWKKGIDENNMPIRGICSEDRQAVRSYFQIMNVLGSKAIICDVIEKQKLMQNSLNFSSLNERYGFIFEGHGSDFNHDNYEILMDKFEKMSNFISTNECSQEMFLQSAIYDDELHETSYNHSFNDSARTYSHDCILDSKYMSQWGEPLDHHNKFDVSLNNESQQNTFLNDKLGVCKESDRCLSVETNDNSDDDVVFVGVTQQSTPIRKCSLKQSLLKFNEAVLGKSFITTKPAPVSKPCQTITSRSIEIPSKGTMIQDLSPKLVSRTSSEKSEYSQENHASYFDDQFDDIILANSGIIKHIENSTAISPNNLICLENNSNNKSVDNSSLHLEVSRRPACLLDSKSMPKPQQNYFSDDDQKATVTLDSNDSTPSDIVSYLKMTDYSLIDKTASQDNLGKVLRNEPKKSFQNNGASCENYEQVCNAFSPTQTQDKVHPELVNIDMNNFFEAFSDEAIEALNTQIDQNSKASPQRVSPDIFEDLSESTLESKAKTSPQKLVASPQPQTSPCLLSKKPLTWKEIRLKYCNQSHSKQQKLIPLEEDSVIHFRSKIKRRIVESDTDSSEDDSIKHPKLDSIVGNNKTIRKNSLRKKRINDFIDDEAALSGSASEDEFEKSIGCYIQDSVVVPDDEVENDGVNMTKFYLQSLKNHSTNRMGTFKIPPRRQFNDASRIFSQRVPEDSGSYECDSFVVSDEDGDVDQSMCPLERAEAILKANRQAKRKAKLTSGYERVQPAKKKRILRIHNSSDEDFV